MLLTADHQPTSKCMRRILTDYAHVDRQTRPTAVQPESKLAPSYMRGADGRLYEVSSSKSRSRSSTTNLPSHAIYALTIEAFARRKLSSKGTVRATLSFCSTASC
jgi:hypothetical protein